MMTDWYDDRIPQKNERAINYGHLKRESNLTVNYHYSHYSPTHHRPSSPTSVDHLHLCPNKKGKMSIYLKFSYRVTSNRYVLSNLFNKFYIYNSNILLMDRKCYVLRKFYSPRQMPTSRWLKCCMPPPGLQLLLTHNSAITRD